MCGLTCLKAHRGYDSSDNELPYRGALGFENDAVVYLTTRWHGPRQSRKAIILRPRAITPRKANSPAVGLRFVSLSNMDLQIQTNKNKLKSEHSHQCSGNTNAFCYVFSEYVTQKCQRNITVWIKKLYKECFHVEIKNQQSDWVPYVICGLCCNMLYVRQTKK